MQLNPFVLFAKAFKFLRSCFCHSPQSKHMGKTFCSRCVPFEGLQVAGSFVKVLASKWAETEHGAIFLSCNKGLRSRLQLTFSNIKCQQESLGVWYNSWTCRTELSSAKQDCCNCRKPHIVWTKSVCGPRPCITWLPSIGFCAFKGWKRPRICRPVPK